MRIDYRKMPRAVHRDNKDNYNEGDVSLKGNIYTVVDVRSHGNDMLWKCGPGTRKRTTKYLKIW